MNTSFSRRSLPPVIIAAIAMLVPLKAALGQQTNANVDAAQARSLQDVFEAAERNAARLRTPSTPQAGSTPAPSEDPNTPMATPRLYILVSFSMPEAALTRLAAQATRLHVPLVLRGLSGDSLPETAGRSRALIAAAPGASLEIDPLPFRRFGVTQVPAFVLAVPAPGCVTACDATPTTRVVVGDVSLDYALAQLAREPSPLAPTAAALLATWRQQP